jgi:Ni,Fe-hydrogenase III large subunit/Ni,Fe-hydrogenase III component G
MRPPISGLKLEPMPGAAPAWHAQCDARQWLAACRATAAAGGRLGALWASDERDTHGGLTAHALVIAYEGLLWLELSANASPGYPDLSEIFPCAKRMQRAAFDLVGLPALAPDGKRPDVRGWLRHGAWAADTHPLQRDVALDARLAPGDPRYAFVAVEGDGVHEIPVGPVHAGTIEPGHFRFSIVGERVLRLEQRLGYKHKGIEKRFESLSLVEAARLAGRVSGDSTVAYAWAYAMACEAMAGARPGNRALRLRALLLERERIANHLGDLGFIGNDGGLAVGLAQFSRLKEDLLRSNAALFGHRYLMDRIVPGGVAVDIDGPGRDRLLAEADRLETELRSLRAIYYDHAGLQDRCINCGRLAPRTAAELGVVGLAARASGHAMDARVHPGIAPYDEFAPRLASHRNGDVAARIVVRFEEIFEALQLERRLLQGLPADPLQVALAEPQPGARGLGWVEGWRGEVLVALEAGPGGRVRRCHPHDPSWQNWPALEHAVLGNIVPDFPLINKSFNLSYAGADL